MVAIVDDPDLSVSISLAGEEPFPRVRYLPPRPFGPDGENQRLVELIGNPGGNEEWLVPEFALKRLCHIDHLLLLSMGNHHHLITLLYYHYY